MNHEILLSYGRKAIAAMVAHTLRKTRHVGGEFQVGTLIKNKLLGVGIAYKAFAGNGYIFRHIQLVGNETADAGRTIGVHLHADNRAAAPPLERTFEHAHQIFGLFFNFKIAVPDDAEQALAQNIIARKEFWQEFLEHGLQ